MAYWRNGYDWRRQERAINAFPQYRVSIDGAPSTSFINGIYLTLMLSLSMEIPDPSEYSAEERGWRKGEPSVAGTITSPAYFACMTCTPSQSGCGNAAINALQRWIYS